MRLTLLDVINILIYRKGVGLTVQAAQTSR